MPEVKYTGQRLGSDDIGKKPPARWLGKVPYDNKRRKFNKKK
tara:strand:+ start:45079 stop:45204 length:126 start_codon:yes stop_codon:yes gene_type:complete